MTSVSIEYCVPCGLLDRAVTLQRALLEAHGEALDEVALETGDGGVFRVSVDGEPLYDKDEADGEYDVGGLVERVGERL